MEGSTAEDPLIRPCKCTGSIERVHLHCLREWTRSRLSLDENHLGSYSFKSLPCELCKTTFPTYMTRADGTRSPLMELPKTRAPYIVLESMTRERSDMIRSVHVMSLAEKPLTLGRSKRVGSTGLLGACVASAGWCREGERVMQALYHSFSLPAPKRHT